MRKKKIVYSSNYCRSFTGFGRNAKGLLKHLYKTGKYDLVEYASGVNWSNPELNSLPWKAYGTLPDTQQEMVQLMQGLNPNDQAIKQRQINYGAYNIDRLIKQEKPDIFIGSEDIWAFNGYYSRKWWNKITCIIQTTLDSLPILNEAVEAAKDIKHYYVWAPFAERAMHKLGHTHVKTLRGCLEVENFYRLHDDEKLKLRKKYNIPATAFIGGFVFRNQLRKSVPNLLKGFKLFLNENPKINAYLLLHTNFAENMESGGGGWNIPQYCKELEVDPSRVLTTYICKNCHQYEIKPYQLPKEELDKHKIDVKKGQKQPCRFCGGKDTQKTTSVTLGVSDAQLNEIYNLMDIYLHGFTSGGLEYPCLESKSCELITAVTNYVCGEDYTTEKSGGLPLNWSEYREPHTSFIKASTNPTHIAEQMKVVFNMKPNKKRNMGKRARQFVLDNFSVPVIGKQVEEIIDNCPYIIDVTKET